MSPRHTLRCRWGAWQTQPVRGNKIDNRQGMADGQRQWWLPVLEAHAAASRAANGLAGQTEDRPWHLDIVAVGVSSLMSPCARCNVYPATRLIGLLRLCQTCVLQPTCAPFAHDYHGTHEPGSWACLTCGAVLTSQNVSTDPVAAP